MARRKTRTRKHETPRSIIAWQRATFGPASSVARLAARANNEMAEALDIATSSFSTLQALAKLREECADVAIVLCAVVDAAGGDLWREVEAKMAINRKRKWNVGADGVGQHIAAEDVKRAAGSR